jgi:hypothetical protein
MTDEDTVLIDWRVRASILDDRLKKARTDKQKAKEALEAIPAAEFCRLSPQAKALIMRASAQLSE